VRSDRKKTQRKEVVQTWKKGKKRKDGSFGKVWIPSRSVGIILIPLWQIFSQTQQQQMAMVGQFIGAMTQFMSKNSEQ